MTNKLTLEQLSEDWKCGLLSNPFQYLAQMKDGKKSISKLVDTFLRSTQGSSLENDIFIKSEKLLLESLAHYVYKEAPAYEQNFLMVAELMAAHNAGSSEGSPSDLDRLLDMLKTKSPRHPAVAKYNEFRNSYKSPVMLAEILRSCHKRLAPISPCCADNVFAYIEEDREIFKLAYALTANIYSIDDLPPTEVIYTLSAYVTTLLCWLHGKFCLYGLNSLTLYFLADVVRHHKHFHSLLGEMKTHMKMKYPDSELIHSMELLVIQAKIKEIIDFYTEFSDSGSCLYAENIARVLLCLEYDKTNEAEVSIFENAIELSGIFVRDTPLNKECIDDFQKRLSKTTVKTPEHKKRDNLKQIKRIHLNEDQKEVLNGLLSLDKGESASRPSITQAKEILDAELGAMDDVKELILRYIAAQSRVKNFGQVLLLHGPKGCGKTTVCRAAAKALGRECQFIYMQTICSGWELTGSDKTWSQASVGNILRAIQKAGTFNTVVVFDEVDKASRQSVNATNPQMALLGLLDDSKSEFIDAYLGVPVDMSPVIFMLTANDLDAINPIMLDRCQLIEIPGYADDEKRMIFSSHILPGLYHKYNFTADDVIFTGPAIDEIHSCGRYEPGLRTLQKVAEMMLLDASLQTAYEPQKHVKFTAEDIRRVTNKSLRPQKNIGFMM